MKKIITLLVFLITGTSLAQSVYFDLSEKDSLGIQEYIPKRYLEAADLKQTPKFITMSAGIYKQDKKNLFYGIYVEYDSTYVQKDTLLAIVTKTGSYLLKECKSSRELNVPFTSVFVPDINQEGFYKFIATAEIIKISFSGAYFGITNNPTYFTEIFNEIKVKPNYFE